MGEDHKKRVEAALAKYLEKQDKFKPIPKRKNAKPEQDTVDSIMWWCRNQGWSVDVVEAKAVYNVKAQRYISSQAVPGMSDIVGCDPNGMAVYLEIKAIGRRSTLKPHQRAFLLEKIERGAFGGCFDSVELLDATYTKWREYRAFSPVQSQTYLKESLPPEPTPRNPFIED